MTSQITHGQHLADIHPLREKKEVSNFRGMSVVQDTESDYVTCGAFLSMRHPIRIQTRSQHCVALIPVKDLPGPCPACQQWKS